MKWPQLLTNGSKLKIALTQRVLYHKGRAYDSIEHGWYRYLVDHTLYFIPNRLDQDFNSIVEECDSLIITGGDDSALRRAVEFKLATAMMMAHKPVVGVCHGSFMLSDVLGGVVSPVFDHMDCDHIVDYYGQQILVNSYHTQTITELHSSGRVLATDSNGHCEAWIDGNIAGITWHPERMENPWIPSEINNLLYV